MRLFGPLLLLLSMLPFLGVFLKDAHDSLTLEALTPELPLQQATAQEIPSQEEIDPDAQALAEIQEVIDTLYASVTFEKGETGDWALLESLLMDGAIFVQPARRGAERKVQTTAEFVQSFKDDIVQYRMSETGFWERVVHTTPMVFGDLASVQVVFEVRVEKDSKEPQGRGLDSLSMVRTSEGWRIASIVTEFERPHHPLPKALLQ